jgi:hypothetical protein
MMGFSADMATDHPLPGDLVIGAQSESGSSTTYVITLHPARTPLRSGYTNFRTAIWHARAFAATQRVMIWQESVWHARETRYQRLACPSTTPTPGDVIIKSTGGAFTLFDVRSGRDAVTSRRRANIIGAAAKRRGAVWEEIAGGDGKALRLLVGRLAQIRPVADQGPPDEYGRHGRLT